MHRANAERPEDASPDEAEGSSGSTGTRRRRGGRGRGGRGRGGAGGTGGTTTTEEDATSSSSPRSSSATQETTGDARPAGSHRHGDRRRRRDDPGVAAAAAGAVEVEVRAAPRTPEQTPASQRDDAQPDEAAAEATPTTRGEGTGSGRRRRRGGRGRNKGAAPHVRDQDDRDAREGVSEHSLPRGAGRLRRPPRADCAPGRSAAGARRQREPLVVPPRITDKLMVITEHGDRDQIAVLGGERPRPALRHAPRRALDGGQRLPRPDPERAAGMEAAFVDIGRGRNGVLYAGEVNYSPEDLEGGRPPRIEQVLRSGQAVMVQVTKDPMGGKGARLTAQISLPGRFLVLAPDQDVSGISRRLSGRPPASEVDPEQAEAQGARRDRPHGRRGRHRGGDHARPDAPARSLGADPARGEEGQGAGGPVRGAGAHGPCRPGPLHRRGVPRTRDRLRAGVRQGVGLRPGHRPRPRVQGHAASRPAARVRGAPHRGADPQGARRKVWLASAAT